VAFGYGSAAASQPSASAGFSKGKSSSGAGGGRGGHSGNGADVKPFLQGKSANIRPETLSNYSSSLRLESLVYVNSNKLGSGSIIELLCCSLFLCFRLI
jgi:hypothetical protein